MTAKIPAVAYYRMSTDRQETSIADQRKAVERHAAENGYRLVEEYKDEGVSGWKSTQRKGFQAMIDAAASKKFQAVIVWDQDRFSRFGPREFMHYWHLLSECGVDIVSITQGKLEVENFGWLTAGITQHGKEQYCRDLAKNVCRGMSSKRLEGQWFGRAPYGMTTIEKLSPEGKKLRLLAPGNPEEVQIVRRIFRLRLEGLGTHVIAMTLNDDDLKTATGKQWKSQTIAGILERPAYVGDNMIGKFEGGGFQKLVEEPTLIKNTHEGIIDRETFDKVQAIPRQKRSNVGRGSNSIARLRGFINCGRCGGPMYSLKQSSGNYLYRCGNYSDATRRKDGKRCVHCAVNLKQFELAVFNQVRDVLLRGSREKLEAAIRRELGRRKLASQDDRDNAANLKKQLKRLDSQIDRASERLLMVDEDLFEDAQAKLRELKGRRQKLGEQRWPVEQPSQPSVKSIADRLWRLDDVLRNSSAPAARLALGQIVSGIVCDFEIDEAKSTPGRKRVNFVGAEIVLRESVGTTAEGH